MVDERDLQNRYERLRHTRTEAGLKHRVGELEAALRALVAVGPIRFHDLHGMQSDPSAVYECHFCGAQQDADEDRHDPFPHTEGCPWLKARAVLGEREPQEG